MKTGSKGTRVKALLSGLFGPGKGPSNQLASGGTHTLTSTPPSIIAQGESSQEPHRTMLGMGNARNDILNADGRSTMSRTQYSDAPEIVGNDSPPLRHDRMEEINPHSDAGAPTNESTGFFNNARQFVVQGSSFMNINQSVGDKEAKAKELLSRHMIPGAAHDSSARDPPPKCHPGTRIKINESVIAWFYDETKRELVLWIYGPAGVGKSAIVQTFAEALATAKCLGASVFFSRPNGRNDSHGVFITIAYQLSVHIEPYCAFISEKLAFDPDLVNKSIEEQFKAFIVEPFALRKIGAGGNTWGILLDGLDELDYHHQQQKIISLIATFAHDHPEIPLVWVISIRPEPHITNTFKQQQAMSSYQEEYVPIDSPESCQDVEHFLRSSLQTIQEVKFPHIVTKGWPDETTIVKLAHAASGLFAFADVAVRFIEDPKYADPMTRLDDVLSVIDGSRITFTDDQPFTHLDALYTRILTRIPPKVWLITQRVLGAISWYGSMSVKLLSVILDLQPSKIYTSINDLYSTLDIPHLNEVYVEHLRFHHTSFVDFLYDPERSKLFCISSENVRRDFDEGCLKIWQEFKSHSTGIPGSEYKEHWSKYASQFHSEIDESADVLDKFNNTLFTCVHVGFGDSLQRLDLTRRTVQQGDSQRYWSELLDLLCQLDAVTMCHGFDPITRNAVVEFLLDLWRTDQEVLRSRGVVNEIRLDQLRLDHLEWPKEYPTHTRFMQGRVGTIVPAQFMELSTANSFSEYISGLKQFQERQPTLPVLIWGTYERRFAIFKYMYTEDDFRERSLHTGEITQGSGVYGGYYSIPYPDSVL